MFRNWTVTMMMSILEDAAGVCSPPVPRHIPKIERIKRAATKLAPSLRDPSDEEELRKVNLSTLQQRREKRDLIMVYSVQVDVRQGEVAEKLPMAMGHRRSRRTWEKTEEGCC